MQDTFSHATHLAGRPNAARDDRVSCMQAKRALRPCALKGVAMCIKNVLIIQTFELCLFVLFHVYLFEILYFFLCHFFILLKLAEV